MLLRKYWIPMTVFIVAIVGVGLYSLQPRPSKDPILIVTPVEVEKPAAKAPVVEQPEQVGHIHEDGTFHVGQHETPKPSTERNTSQVSEPSRPEVSNVAPRRLPEDVFSAEYTAQVKAAVQTCVSNFPTSGDEEKIARMDEAYGLLIDASNDARRLTTLAYETKNPSYQARADEIRALMEPFDSLTASIPRPKLDADQLAELERAAQEFEAIMQRLSPTEQQRLRDQGIDNPYRSRLEEEQNR